ncbi:PREDICTED: uncharacterized protein LOC108974571 isoform X2 [Bactrocera latifrons]|uniref:uncharacterized protein LOC108974571 isoform X2 n=1 Tax=Bactrocera latifrons TaxID=174628 RepID=UPI0008DD059A|nr:PREDICTED: uncharacterized protein LOC108974571 isoform X2 [Bactrocera latifrons]
MNSLILINYLEQQAKGNSKLQELLTQTAQCLVRKEEKRKLENETLINTMDVYELESILKQLKLQYQQQCAVQKEMLTVYKHSVEFCVQVHNIDWNSQLHCKLELLQLQCQNEMRELSEEYEEEKERRKALEQRPIVQKVRAAETAVANMQVKIDNAKQRATAYQSKLFEQLDKVQNEQNAIIVLLVKGSKEIAAKEAELAVLESTYNAQRKDLMAQKQELISKMQTFNTKLPVYVNANELEPSLEKAATNHDFTLSIATKLDTFPTFGNTVNANTDVKPKEISFLDLFKEWELQKQKQIQELVTTTVYSDFTSIVPNLTVSYDSEADHTNTIPDSGPKSILRRPNIAENEGDALIPKKRVRFATHESAEDNWDFIPTCHASFNPLECDVVAGIGEVIDNDTFLVEDNVQSFNGDTETIEIFSTDEVLRNENGNAHCEELSGQKPTRPEFVTAKKLLRKARLQGSQRQSKVHTISSAVEKRSKIEIRECRIVKPAGTKLPMKLPIALTPEPQAQPTNATIAIEPLQPTKNKVFKTPPVPKVRKQDKIPDRNNFFDDFLKESSVETSQTNSEVGPNPVKDPNAMLSFDESMGTSEKSKRRGKKPSMDFESFFRETLKSCNDDSAALQVSPTEEDNDLLQFDLNFADNNGLSNSNYEDFFGDQENAEEDDDLLSFNFSD